MLWGVNADTGEILVVDLHALPPHRVLHACLRHQVAFIARVREKGRRDCVALMTRSAEWWNKNAATPGKRIVRVETHHKQWDFVKEREDRVNWGKTIAVLAVEIDPAAVASGAGATQGG